MSPANGPLDAYRARLASGALKSDAAQCHAAEQLQLLANRLSHWQTSRQRSVLDLLRGRRVELPSGLYIFGDVGRGKTMLMDLFYEHVDFARKKRVHFHPFMRDVHALIRQKRGQHEGDPIPMVADDILRDVHLLCLDELHVNDITDAMILGRLFAHMFARDLIIVATSNAAPRDLYKDGLNRQLFLPFIDLVEERMEVLQLEAVRDYRLDEFAATPHFFTPLGAETTRRLDDLWQQWAGHVPPHSGSIQVASRRVKIPCMGGGMARFSFDDLCGTPLGASDYLALCAHFHTFFIDDIPQLTRDQSNLARRFTTLIDTLYDEKRRLIVSCAVEPDDIYLNGPGADSFTRTSSRLNEMRGPDWPPME